MKSAESSIYLDVYSCIRAINKRYGLKRQIDIALLNAIYAAYLDGANLRVIDILLFEDGLSGNYSFSSTRAKKA
jgi:hypothetical protein